MSVLFNSQNVFHRGKVLTTCVVKKNKKKLFVLFCLMDFKKEKDRDASEGTTVYEYSRCYVV